MLVDIFNTDKKYSIIYADPPWSYKDKRCNGNCENHYRTMPIKDILTLPIGKIADKDCALFFMGDISDVARSVKNHRSLGIYI